MLQRASGGGGGSGGGESPLLLLLLMARRRSRRNPSGLLLPAGRRTAHGPRRRRLFHLVDVKHWIFDDHFGENKRRSAFAALGNSVLHFLPSSDWIAAISMPHDTSEKSRQVVENTQGRGGGRTIRFHSRETKKLNSLRPTHSFLGR